MELRKSMTILGQEKTTYPFKKKLTANKARTFLIKSNIKAATVQYLFGDYYLKIHNMS